MWADILGIEQVSAYDNFFELGGHSLSATQLIFKLRELFQIELPLRILFESSTLSDLARIITTVRRGEFSAEMQNVSVPDLTAESTLDPGICPVPVHSQVRSETEHIFLTGATGFLGAFLLYELLQQTQSTIFCLVRSRDVEEGHRRIRQTLKSYALWEEQFVSRIVPVPGDLSRPVFGLSVEQFDHLSRQINVIYHNGAIVNFIAPYSTLKAANVLGTQEVLKLACVTKTKPVHYISTLSVFDSPMYSRQGVIDEHTPLDCHEGLFSGYAQSKWVAEKFVEIAGSRGLPVYIYRPGRITGNSQTGVWNTDDFVCSMLKGCIQLGYAPYLEIMVDMVPVDYVSDAIVYLSKQQNTVGQAFHLVNPQPIQWNRLIHQICSFGYPLQQIPYDRWQALLFEDMMEHSSENALHPLLPLFLDPEAISQERWAQRYNCQNTLARLAGTAIACPPIDASLLHTYFTYFIRSGFLQPSSPNDKNIS
jgi:thioester reductase-like protein